MAITAASKPIQFCINLVEQLERNPASPSNVMQRPAFLERLLSEDNREAWSFLDSSIIPGKSAPGTTNGTKITLQYEKPYCPGGTSAPNTNVCDVTGSYEDEMGYLEVNVDQVAERHFVVNLADYVSLCENPNEKIPSLLRRKAYEIKMEINQAIITESYALAGNYQDGTASTGASTKGLTVINQKGEIIPAGFVPIHLDLQRAGYLGQKFIIGGETLGKYYFTQMYGTNPNFEAQAQNFSAMPFIYDPLFDTTYQGIASDSNSHGLVVPVGSMVLQQWYNNTGAMAISTENRISNTIEIDDMEYDFDLYFDECNKVFKVKLSKPYGVGAIPGSVYCGGNGLIQHYLFNCGDWSCENGMATTNP